MGKGLAVRKLLEREREGKWGDGGEGDGPARACKVLCGCSLEEVGRERNGERVVRNCLYGMLKQCTIVGGGRGSGEMRGDLGI